MQPIKVLLQTTIQAAENDWSIARFSRLAELLRDQRSASGEPIFEVTTRDRSVLGEPDSVLSRLDGSDFDELWLFAVDVGDGLTLEDCQGISRFLESGRGLMVTRDHMDLGSSVCDLAGIGKAHHFHTKNVHPDPADRAIDDRVTSYISWPNYHSGANGDYQQIRICGAPHPVLISKESPTGAIRYLPAHPHEGSVSAPEGESARVIATGTSKTTAREFPLAVAFEATNSHGRAIAQSTFHHFVDYNWDTTCGAPTFVDEPPGNGIVSEPQALQDAHRYAINVALWLARAI